MDDQNTMSIPNDENSFMPVRMMQALTYKNKHFLSKKNLQNQRQMNFQQKQRANIEAGKKQQKFRQNTQVYLYDKFSIEDHIECNGFQTSQSLAKEKIKSNRMLKQKNQKVHAVVMQKNRSHFDSFYLKEIIKQNKIKAIVNNFIGKLKRNSVKNKPVQFDIKQNLVLDNEQYQAIQLSSLNQIIFIAISIFHIIAANIIHSLNLVFMELRSSKFIKIFMLFSFLLFLLELFLNVCTVKYISGKKVKKIQEVWRLYLKTTFYIDAFTILIIFLNIFSHQTWIIYLSTIVFLKIPTCLKKIEKVEAYFISNLYNQQFWSLAKIVLSNFAFAHVISILLSAMPLMNTEENWMIKRNILNLAWHQRYIWSYYWGNTIMLTVGFGDIVVSNSSQALCLIFVQTFSCLIFAYNITCIGHIMHNIYAQGAQKLKKKKIFKKLAQQNDLPEQITWKINNYITQNAQVKKRFNFQQQRQFIVSLPAQMKKQYHKQSNKKVLEKILFFKSFVGKTLLNLAQNIQLRISHPEQIIQNIQDNYNLIILKIGQIAFTCKKFNSETKDLSMDKLSVTKPYQETILNLDFITRRRQPYEIKSLEYTIYYFLGYDKFMEIIKESSFDYEYLCSLRDKVQNIPDEFQVFPCTLCQGKHLKASCPKLHFMPYKESVVYRYLHQKKISKNCRKNFIRDDSKQTRSYAIYVQSINHKSQLMNISPNKRRNRFNQIMRTLATKSDNIFPSLKTQIIEKVIETQIDKQIMIINQKYKNMAGQIIKEQINKIMKKQQLEDEVWSINLDVLKDYSNYFPIFNPSNIKGRYEGSIILQKNELIKLHIEVNLCQHFTMQEHKYKSASIFQHEALTKNTKLTI